MKKVILDTNCFIRLFLNDIPAQVHTVELYLQKAKSGEVDISVPEIVLFEIQFILSKYYNVDKQIVVSHLKAIVSSEYLTVVSRKTFLKALDIFKTNSVSFADCFLAAQADLEKRELVTFDKRLASYCK